MQPILRRQRLVWVAEYTFVLLKALSPWPGPSAGGSPVVGKLRVHLRLLHLARHDVPLWCLQVASMMPSDEAEAPLEYQKGSIGAIADR